MGGRCIGPVGIAVFTAASTSPTDRADARTGGQRFALIADVSLGTAVLAAGFTASWYFYKYKRSSRNPKSGMSPRSPTPKPRSTWFRGSNPSPAV